MKIKQTFKTFFLNFFFKTENIMGLPNNAFCNRKITVGLPGSAFCTQKTTTGFTLVETLVAISILMLAVTGPLYYATESLKAATYAKDQITAFYLAQDAFEQIRKIRDDNIYGSTNVWNEHLNGCTTGCRVNADGGFSSNSIDSDILGDKTFLYMNIGGTYSHNQSGTKTIFKRVVKIEPTDGVGGTWTNATEMKVTVNIEWQSRGIQRSFEVYEFMRNLK